MLIGNILHGRHGQLVMIGSDIRGIKNRCQLMLCRCHFVMLRLGIDAITPQGFIQFFHISRYSGLDRAEIVVVQFLTLRRSGTKQGTAAVNQVFALFEHFLIHEEIFLFGADGCFYTSRCRITENTQNTECLYADNLHGTQKRCFLIENFTCIGAESGRNTQRTILNEGIGSGVPCGIASCFKGRTNTAGRETRGIRLAFNQFLAGKFHDNAAALGRRNKAVVLFRRDTGHRLEPVGIMGGTVFQRPFLHRMSHYIRNIQVKRLAFLNRLFQRLIGTLGQTFLHRRIVEYKTAKNLRYFHGLLSPIRDSS